MAAFVLMSRLAGFNSLKNVVGRRICTNVFCRNGNGFALSRLESHTTVARNSAVISVRRYAADVAAQSQESQTVLGGSIPFFARPIQQAGRYSRDAMPVVSPNSIESLLQMMDHQARVWGRVDKHNVLKLIRLVIKAGQVDTQTSCMLLRCTGAFLTKESPAERIELCEKACKAIEAGGNVFNINMYNTLLRTMLENGQKFDPAEVLTDIEVRKKLVPTKQTYTWLMAQYCELGDIDGASKIVEHMKELNLPLSETIFNALVKGHIRKGDIDGAYAVMKNMSAAGLDTTAETYTVLISSLAETGDIKAIEKALGDARKDDVIMAPRHLLKTIPILADKGFFSHIDNVLDHLRGLEPQGMTHDLLNCIFQLVASGHDDTAYKIFMVLKENNNKMADMGARAGEVLLRAMIMKGRPFDKVIDTWSKLKENDLAPETLHDIAFWSMEFQKGEFTFKVLQKMKDMGEEIKDHYYWPVLGDYAALGDIDGLTSVVQKMMECSDYSPVKFVRTYRRWVVQRLPDYERKREMVYQKLKDVGIDNDTILIIELLYQIRQGCFAEAAKIIEMNALYPEPRIIPFDVISGFIRSGYDVDKLIKFVEVSSKLFRSDWTAQVNNAHVFLGILNVNNPPKDLLENLIPAWTKSGLVMAEDEKPQIDARLELYNLSQDLKSQLHSCFVPRPNRSSSTRVDVPKEKIHESSVAELESLLKNSPGNKLYQKHLLAKYCLLGDIVKAEALKAEMDAGGFVLSPDCLRNLGILAVKWKNNLDEAVGYLRRLQSEFPDYNRYDSLALNIAILQMDSGKCDDAIATLDNCARMHRDEDDAKIFANNNDSKKLVKATVKNGSLPQTLKVLDHLSETFGLGPRPFALLDTLITDCMDMDDPDKLLAAVDYSATKYKLVPNLCRVFSYFIVRDDAERLQKAVDQTTTVFGEMEVLLHLAASFVDSGKVKQARKILETPGLRAVMPALNDACSYFISCGKLKELEQFVDVTKNLFAIERSEMLFQLMMYHGKARDTKSMMEVYHQFEEEGVRMKPRMYTYLANGLKAAGEPVPFEVPAPQPQPDRRVANAKSTVAERVIPATKSTVAESASPLPELKSTVAEGESSSPESKQPPIPDVDELLLQRAKLAETGEKPSTDFTVSVTKKFFRQRGGIKMLQRYCAGLAEAGDIEGLNAVKKLTTSEALLNYVYRSILVAHIVRNKAADVIKYLSDNKDEIRLYSSLKSLLKLHETDVDTLKKFEQLLTDCADHEVKEHLFRFYILTDQLDKAKQLFQNHSYLKDIYLETTCNVLEVQQKEDVLHKLVSIFRKTAGMPLMSSYSHLILLKCSQGDWASALKLYQTGLEDGFQAHEFALRSLKAMQTLAEANNQPVPWPEGTIQKKIAALESRRRQPRNRSLKEKDTSDSSDSSDAEDAKKPK